MVLLVGRGGEPLATVVEYLGAIFIVIQGVKRMHDVDRSGWLLIVPIVNLVAIFADGTPGPNRYGDDPKGRPSVS